jgi:cytochrome c oxidase subunit 4
MDLFVSGRLSALTMSHSPHSSPKSEVSHASQGAHDDHGDIASHVRIYIVVGAALLIGTALTVGMYYVHFSSMALTITIALFIASIKGFLVAGFFMHLISEKRAIYSMLFVTVIFFFALGGLTIWGLHDTPWGSQMKAPYVNH